MMLTCRAMSENPTNSKRAKGAFLLPNAFTTAALLAGFYAMVSAINGQTIAACVAILVAGLLDGVDGRVARMTNTQSDFGVQYDSLSDMVSFGIAPAILVFTWVSTGLGSPEGNTANLVWLAAFFYTACAALRLARFNTQAGGVSDKAYFQGMASPAAAGTVMSTIWFSIDRGLSPEQMAWPVLAVTVLVGALMVSNVRYFSFKQWPASQRVPIARIFFLVAVVALMAIDLPAVLFAIGVIYTTSGLVMTMKGRQAVRKRRSTDRRHEGGGDGGDA